MITRIAIDSDALLEHKGRTRHALNTQRTLVDVLRSYGLVEFLGVADKDAFFDAVTQLDTAVKEVWEKALVALYDLNRVKVGGEVGTVRHLVAEEPVPKELLALAELIVVRGEVAAQRGLPLEGYARRGDEPELSVAESALHCNTIKQLREMRERGNFPKGTQRSTIWEAVLAAPVHASTEVTLLEHHFLNHALTRKGARRDHLEWLVGALDRMLKPGSTLRILSELPAIRQPPETRKPPKLISPARAEAILRPRIEPLLGAGNLARVEVVLAPWPDRFDERPHNRHLRFSCGVAISASEGFDHLSSPEVAGLDGFTWQAVTSAELLGDLSKREQMILNRGHRVTIQVP